MSMHLSFFVLACQSNSSTTLFLFFYLLLPSHAISSAILTVITTHIAPTQMSLVALCQDIGKTHNTTGAIAMGHLETRGWTIRSVPLAPVAKTCTGLAVQPFWPDGPSIATSMPDGDSNSRCMCLACGPFWHLGRQAVHA
jgi:hypothetical protein